MIRWLLLWTFIFNPATQGIYEIDDGHLTIAYGTFIQTTSFTLTPNEFGFWAEFDAANTMMPIVLRHADADYVIDAPGQVTPIPAGEFLIYFDTVAVFAQQDTTLYLVGMLEDFHPDMLSRPADDAQAVITSRAVHQLVVGGEIWPAASQYPRFANRFAGQNMGHAATFGVLGWTDDLPGLFQAMTKPIPPDLPLPGEAQTPLDLWLPFDCEHDWLVSWGYHFSTAQNRYAVDFASAEGPGMALGLPIRAAHAGTVQLKSFGGLDLGLAVRVNHPDGLNATLYGHLDPATLDLWGMDDLPAFEWVTVGEVAAGAVIGTVGLSGYSVGPHIHFALLTHGQSIYRPAFDTILQFERGLAIPASARLDCERYGAMGINPSFD